MEERVQTYINGQTPIMAEELNAIQDAIIGNSTLIGTQATQISGKAEASALTAETAAREAAVSAEATARAAADTAEATARAAADTALTSEVSDLKSALLLQDEAIPDTTQAIVFDASGNVQRITHTGANSAVIRTDVFTFGANTITEVRTLNTGESLTIVTNTDTLITTVTYADAA